MKRPVNMPLRISITFLLIFVFYTTDAQTVVRLEAKQPPKLETVLSDSLFSMNGTGYIFGENLTINGGTGPFNYTWSRDNQVISTTPVLDIPSTSVSQGVYSLTIRDSRNCSVTLITTGINESLVRNEQVNVYPVPANDYLYINPGSVTEELLVTLTDYSGKVLLSRRISGLSRIEFKIPGGIYQLKAETLNGELVGIRKIVVL